MERDPNHTTEFSSGGFRISLTVLMVQLMPSMKVQYSSKVSPMMAQVLTPSSGLAIRLDPVLKVISFPTRKTIREGKLIQIHIRIPTKYLA